MIQIQGMSIDKLLEEIGSAVLSSLSYGRYPYDRIDVVLQGIDELVSDEESLRQCESHFKSSGSNYVLFFLSNIIYNLKAKGDLVLTPDALKWLSSVWKNFIQRNKKYQDFFPAYDRHSQFFEKYYPGAGVFINQIENVHAVKQDFIDDSDEEYSKIKSLEAFFQISLDILNTMRPTYFFLLDYYYERRIQTGEDMNDAMVHEREGLNGFGFNGYTYLNVLVVTCQCLGILEAVYLSLKKKKMSKRIVSIDGKQKLLSTSDVYDYYLNKFNLYKKELSNINKDL